MAKLHSRSTGEIKHPSLSIPSRELVEKLLVGNRVNTGMITTIDPADIPDGALTKAKNARVRYDKTSRRLGTVIVTPTKPNSNPIIGLAYIKRHDGNEYTFRATRNSLHRRGVTWVAIAAGASGSLTGADTDQFQFVTAFNRLFFANNGVNSIHEVDFAADQYKRLSNAASPATNFRFITSFYNRIVGACLGGASADRTHVGWSADGVLEEFNASVNETAGGGPLVSSPSDKSDFITGLRNVANMMLVMREKSIWLATKKPVATDPFDFRNAFPGIGCDCPYSLQVCVDSVAWFDTLTKAVWAYTPGGVPERISLFIENEIIKSINDVNTVFSGFDPVELEYYIGVPVPSSNIVKLWIWSFKSKGWVYDEVEAVSHMLVSPIGAGVLTIGELNGTIGGLTSTIGSLVSSTSISQSRLYGRLDGEITREDPLTYTDLAYSGSSGVYDTELNSKEFVLPEVDSYFSRIVVEIIPRSAGSVTIWYQKDNKVAVAHKTKTFGGGDIEKKIEIRIVKQLKCKRLKWFITANTGSFDVTNYEVKVFPSGVSRG